MPLSSGSLNPAFRPSSLMPPKKRRSRTGKTARRKKTKDVGIPRVQLASIVERQIDKFGLSRNDAAIIVRDAASQVSRLMTGHAYEFSSDRLIEWLTRLGTDVTLRIKHAKKLGRRGKVRITVE